jgi:hypothetical protein
MTCEDCVLNGFLSVKDITEAYNHDKLEKARITTQRVGRCLTALGFGKGRTGNGSAAILWDKSVLARMYATYGIGQRSETPEFPESPMNPEVGSTGQVMQLEEKGSTIESAEESEKVPSTANKEEERAEDKDWGTIWEGLSRRNVVLKEKPLF